MPHDGQTGTVRPVLTMAHLSYQQGETTAAPWRVGGVLLVHSSLEPVGRVVPNLVGLIVHAVRVDERSRKDDAARAEL